MKNLKDDNYCFACGKINPIGLKLDFTSERNRAVSKFNLNRNYQGWEGIVHGGIISTMLDEAMVKAASSENIKCVTAEINVRFRSPLKIKETYILTGMVEERKRNILISSANIKDSSGNLYAESSGKLFIINSDEKPQK